MLTIASFLETRGQIHATLGNHAEAVRDLNRCRELGKDNAEIQRALDASQKALGL